MSITKDPAYEYETLICMAGHPWEHKKVGKAPPKYCPQHKRFIQGPISIRSQPKSRLIQEWEDAEENLVNERGYAARWLKFWRDNVRIIAARAGSWGKIDLVKYEAYVRHMRLAELHRLFAQDRPYYTTESGAIKAHPGWNNAEREARKARKLGIELGLVLEDKRTRGPAQRQPSKLEEEADEHGGIEDDQIGPDGEPL